MKLSRIIKSGVLVGVAAICISARAQDLVSVAGCTDTDLIEGSAINKIATMGATYTPKCLKVKVGASVEIAASRHHPLTAMPDIAGAKNPFSDGTSFKTNQTRIMSAPGVYGYYCEAHGDDVGDGMAGVIVVVP